MNASFYFWKWAENDLPGKLVEVQAALLRGRSHPALYHRRNINAELP